MGRGIQKGKVQGEAWKRQLRTCQEFPTGSSHVCCSRKGGPEANSWTGGLLFHHRPGAMICEEREEIQDLLAADNVASISADVSASAEFFTEEHY